MNFSSKIEKCSYSPIRKFYPLQVECEKKGTKIYHLNIGQPDIRTPQGFFDAIRRFDDEVVEYAPSPGIPQLIEAVRNYYSGIGVGLSAGDIVVTTGGSEALSLTFSTVLDDGDELLVPEPLYSNYLTFANLSGGKVVPIPTDPENGYRYACRELLQSYVSPRSRAILITNPGNPTGVVLTRDEMRIIADFAKDNGLFLIVDEVYREFVYGGQKLSSFSEFDDIDENLIIIDSVSKRFSACGARVGALISRNSEFMAHVMKICQARLSVATLDQLGAAEMYKTDKSFFDEVRCEYKKRRDAVCEELAKIPGVRFDVPEGAFYLMATLPVDDTDAFQRWLFTDFELDGETVMFAPGAGFYSSPGKGASEIRIAYVRNCDYLRRSIRLLAAGIEAYNSKKA
ncbi:MAG: pyridoxal phosphate-dependent aminotransferase [Firmicutes bacterium]|nr:pyridoxal phosphate-dependent aminotransferase [Bacillota bacterium]